MDVGKREDRLLDTISELIKNRNAVRGLLEFYQEANLISPEVSAHLWEVLNGLETEAKV